MKRDARGTAPTRLRLALVAPTLAAFALALVIAARWSADPGDAVGPSAVESAPSPRRPDASLAVGTADRLELFRTGNSGARLTLDSNEITALLLHVLPGVLPPGVSDPAVRLVDGTAVVTARLASDAFPATALLSPVLEVLPDTIDIEITGTLLRRGARLALAMERVTAQKVPVPRAIIASVVAALDERVGEIESADADALPTLSVAWPRGISTMQVAGELLVLGRDEPLRRRAVDGSGGG